MPVRRDWLYSFLFFILFAAVSIPGIDWGVPSFWHPDELIKNVDKMIRGVYQLDATYFNHPFLPIHVFRWIGELAYSLGHSRSGFIQAARLVNVLLGAGIISLTYLIARKAGSGFIGAFLAAAFALSSSEIGLNARIAHDDIFLGFFTTLSVFTLVCFRRVDKAGWLYASFFSIGLAASCKYNGISLAIAPLTTILIDHYLKPSGGFPSSARRILVGLFLILSGFVLGSPETITQHRLFLTTIQSSMFHHAEFNRQPDTVIGLLGQWQVLIAMLGVAAAALFLAALVYHLIGTFSREKIPWSVSWSNRKAIEVVLLAVLALDLPILIVYNYPARYFLPLVPLLAVLGGIFVEDLIVYAEKSDLPLWRYGAMATSMIVFAISLLRVISVGLLFQHDARIPASAYIAMLPEHTSIEYTYYPPTIPEKHFSRRNSYPLFFAKSMLAGQPAPEWSGRVNQGEDGLEDRQPDFLIIDSLTARRFEDPLTCAEVALECDFFKRLQTNETSYRLLEKFEYHLPDYLPQLSPFFLNPTIWVYARVSE